ncbi:hypothetical protein [Paenibacillus sp. NPDC058177]|uniref:hypothetical protein n=1 Tax=Paenibacillus sp. NPDC058177 TaxID=3346369 RepID=UPI0036D95F8E
MKKRMLLLMLTTSLICSILVPSFASASELSKEEKIQQTIQNFYSSLNEANKNEYLNLIADSNSPENQYAAENLKPSQITYNVIKLEKVSELKYIADILVEDNGTSYPLFPYDIILENGQWKVNTDSFTVASKELLKNRPSGNIFSENDYFIVRKNEYTEANDNAQLAKNSIVAAGTLSYSFGKLSTDIYTNGSVTLYAYPSGYLDGFTALAYSKNGQFPSLVRQEFVDYSQRKSVTFSGLYGYHAYTVEINSINPPSGYYSVYY